MQSEHEIGLGGALLTRAELAARLRCSVGHIKNITRRGEIPVVQLGRLIRFDLAEVLKRTTKQESQQ